MQVLADPGPTAAFRALGDPVRSTIVEHLGDHGATTVNELAALFPISLQAVSRHVKVLEAAGVVSQHRAGRYRPVTLERAAVDAAADWLDERRRRLDARYDRLDRILADLQHEQRPEADHPSPAVHPSPTDRQHTDRQHTDRQHTDRQHTDRDHRNEP